MSTGEAAILTLNAGSSSIKFALYAQTAEGLARAPFLHGAADGIGGEHQRLRVVRGHGAATAGEIEGDGGHDAAWDAVLSAIEREQGAVRLLGVGHRVVHGGNAHAEPVRLTDAVVTELETYVPLAPGHQPHNLAGVRAVAQRWPDVAQIACFDTAFHRAQPALRQRFALPQEWAARGVLRYGFHGLSYQYVSEAAPAVVGEAARGRMIVAHLGHGASMCAMHGGRSVATTMGFTALDGLPMGKRCGNIDPGVLLHLLEEEGLSLGQLQQLLYRRSGLLGLSALSDDMRTLEQSDSAQAAFAVDYFVDRCVHFIGALAADLDGLDAIVFTAGIGEHSARIRGAVLARLAWLGVRPDEEANARHGPCLTLPGSAVSAWVVPTDEQRVIARETARLLADAPGAG